MINAEFKQKGYCIGSGVIEAGCKTIIDKLLVCPRCQGECKRHGWRKRKARTREAVITIPVLRVRCLDGLKVFPNESPLVALATEAGRKLARNQAAPSLES